MFLPFLHKRMSFQHENELRAIIPDFERRQAAKAGEETAPGLAVPVELDTLVESVWVAPLAPVWVSELVTSVCRRYGLAADVHQSQLDADPLF